MRYSLLEAAANNPLLQTAKAPMHNRKPQRLNLRIAGLTGRFLVATAHSQNEFTITIENLLAVA
jgi:hypothetical protein